MKTTALMAIGLFIVSIVGCSESNPVSGSLDSLVRGLSNFSVLTYPIFPFSTEAGEFSDCDVATVIVGPNTSQPQGSAYVDDLGRQWTAAAALVETQQNIRRGVFRFMGPSNNGPFGDITSCGPPQETQLIRVDACYIGNEKSGAEHAEWIEACFVMQTRPSPNADWDITVNIMRFSPTQTTPALLNQQAWTIDGGGGFDDVHPDVAYDTETGDLVLVYSHWTSNGLNAYVPLNYQVADRHLFSFNPFDLAWKGPFRASAYGGSNGIPYDSPNGWTPRIDIGYVHDAPLLSGTRKLVAIAYTGQWSQVINPDTGQYGPYGPFTPRVTYWELTDTSIGNKGQYDYVILDPAFYGCYAGLPVIDISPAGNDPDCYAAVVYVQCYTLYEYDPHVCFVNTRRFQWLYLDHPSGTFTNATHPSVAIHLEEGGGMHSRASVSFLAQYEEGDWYPWVASVEFDENSSTSNSDIWQPISFDHAGLWDTSHLYSRNYGVNTALTVFGVNNDYWLLYSGLVGSSADPTIVFGAFGNTM